jgi:hypothetical protein
MDERQEAALPPLYATWLREVVGGPIPAETIATCDRCVMLPVEGSSPERSFFLPAVKCCAYQPTLPGFLAGRILADCDSDLRATHGRQALEARIAGRVGVVPSGVRSSGVFRLLFSQTPGVFGRAPALRCPFLAEDGGCGVWRHRPGVCATWFCKHVRGETGFRFWKLADKLLRAVEFDLALWCAAELDTGSAELANLDPEADARPHVSELEGPVDSARYSELWGEWEGREKEFYLACAKLVEPLRWDDVLAICGPQVRVLARLVRQAHRDRTSDAIPERLRLGSVQLTAASDGKYSVASYSPYDPLLMSEQLARALRFFDGRHTEDALAAILAELKFRLDRRLLRRLVDFGLLKAAD